MYDKRYNFLAIQANFYGVTIKQIEQMLTTLKRRWLEKNNIDEEMPLAVELSPIIDTNSIHDAVSSEFIRKIRLRASDIMLDSKLTEGSSLTDVKNVLNNVDGLVVDITVSLGRAGRTKSLNSEAISKIVSEYTEVSGKMDTPVCELTFKKNEDSEIETINLINPRITTLIKIEVEPRTTVAHEFLFNEFLNYFRKKRTSISKILN